MFIFLCNVFSIIIKTKSNGKYIKANNKDIKTTNNPEEATKFKFDVVDQNKMEYIIDFNGKAVDNHRVHEAGIVVLWPRHGQFNQKWILKSTEKGYKILQDKYKISHNTINDTFETVPANEEGGNDLFIFLQDDGKNHYYLKAEDIMDDKPVEPYEDVNKQSDENPPEPAKDEIPFNEIKIPDETSKDKDAKTVNIFLIQNAEGNPGFYSPIPLLPNHTAFRGRRLVTNECGLSSSYFTPGRNLCNIDDGLHGHTKEIIGY